MSLALVGLALGPLLWLFTRDGTGPDLVAAAPSAPVMVEDGTDPKSSGCTADAVSLDIQPVRLTTAVGSGPATLPVGTPIGVVSLRYSPRCAVAWGKFEPDRVIEDPRPVAVTVEAWRPIDDVRAVVQFPRLEPAYGDGLRTAPGCVRVRVTVAFAGTDATAAGVTACLSDPTP